MEAMDELVGVPIRESVKPFFDSETVYVLRIISVLAAERNSVLLLLVEITVPALVKAEFTIGEERLYEVMDGLIEGALVYVAMLMSEADLAVMLMRTFRLLAEVGTSSDSVVEVA
jgi:hypothetical protein